MRRKITVSHCGKTIYGILTVCAGHYYNLRKDSIRTKHLLTRLLPLLFLPLLASCYNHGERTPDAWNLTEQQLDSISFSTTHHYSQNYNFIIKADSLQIVCQAPDELPFDSVVVRRGDRVVVADIMTMPADSTDSVWVKIARDQATQGWIRESTMLPSVEPDDPISQFINTFSDIHLLLFLSLIVVVSAAYGLRFLLRHKARIVHFRDISSFYPTLLALLVASSAVLYASIQLFGAESWRHFYYHPSLNPFALPPHLGILVMFIWAMVIVTIAVVEDVFHRLPVSDAVLYLCGLVAVCAVDYVIFSISTLYYIGYLLLIAYIVFAIHRYFRYSCNRYICGKCGAELQHKGVCPHCGTMNV